MDEIIITNELILNDPLPLDQNPAAVYIASLPAVTGQHSQAMALRTIAGMFGADIHTMNWAGLRYQHTAAIRSKISATYAPATCNKMLSAIRQTLRHAWLLGQMSVEDYMRAISLKTVTGERLPPGRELTKGEILALMTACVQDGHQNIGTRDAAILGLMYGCGLRRTEVVQLSLSSYDAETGTLIVFGKRSKERTAYLVNGARRALEDWLKIRGTDGEALFVEVNKGDHLDTSKHMAAQAIYNLLQKRGTEAKIKNFTPHDVRRSFVTHLLDASADVITVSKMAGHSDPKTTAKYDRRPEEAKRKAASLLFVPYEGRE
jgi:site-specific recombinase XerD